MCITCFSSPCSESHWKSSVVFGINFIFTTRACCCDSERENEIFSWFKVACNCSLIGNSIKEKDNLAMIHTKLRSPYERFAYDLQIFQLGDQPGHSLWRWTSGLLTAFGIQCLIICQSLLETRQIPQLELHPQLPRVLHCPCQ